MYDPIAVPTWLHNAVLPLTNALHLHTLPLHIHEVLLSFIAYNIIDVLISPWLSQLVLPKTYAQFPHRTKLQWNMHVTSFVNSIVLAGAAIWVILADQDRLSRTWEERIWGYTGAAGMVQALSAGYFLWDVRVSSTNVEILGFPDLLHAIVGLVISILGFV